MAPGLLGVVDEVALHVVVGRVDDDLGAVLVGADRAVRAQPEEHGLDLARPAAVGGTRWSQARLSERDVVVDADGEVALGPLGLAVRRRRP